MPDKHEVGGSSPLGPTSETQSVSQVIGNNEEGRSEVLGREGNRFAIRCYRYLP